MKLLDDFRDLLNSDAPPGRQKEQVVQEFLEANSELLTLPHCLNHQLYCDCFISKLPINTSLTTDLAYITKSTVELQVVLLELESPDKKLFVGKPGSISPSSELTAALSQVRSWQIALSKNSAELLRQLEPLIGALKIGRAARNISFKYGLIIGRNSELDSDERTDHWIKLSGDPDLKLLTYDSLVGRFDKSYRRARAVLSPRKGGFTAKHIETEPSLLFATLTHDQLTLSSEQQDYLKKRDYDIDDWLRGEMLVYNDKYSQSGADRRGLVTL